MGASLVHIYIYIHVYDIYIYIRSNVFLRNVMILVSAQNIFNYEDDLRNVRQKSSTDNISKHAL